MDNYIYINNNSLSPLLCNKIIDLFDDEKNKRIGETFGGVNENVKDTIDFTIPNNSNKENKWSKIAKCLNYEIMINVKQYVNKINKSIHNNESGENYTLFGGNPITYSTLQIQKYSKNKGKYTYHDDEDTRWEKKDKRVLTYIWYLNNVDVGGETEIWDSHKITPECGKLLLFPSCWTFPHRGNVPISGDKYILTGWVYY